LVFAEDRQEPATAKQDEGGKVIQLIEEPHRRRDQHKGHQQQHLCRVHFAEETGKRDSQADEDHGADQTRENHQQKHRFMSQDVVRRRSRVAAHNQLAGNIHEAEGPVTTMER